MSKCNVLPFGQRPSPTHRYTISVTPLEQYGCERYVGVLVSSNLKYQDQAATAIATANKVLGLIRRSFQSRDLNTIVAAYKTYARPHLEYCSQVWTPSTKHWQTKLERTLGLITCLKGLSYKEKLKRTGLLPTGNRHLLLDLTEVYKTINKLNTTQLTMNLCKDL